MKTPKNVQNTNRTGRAIPVLIEEDREKFVAAYAPKDCERLNDKEEDCLERGLKKPCSACSEYLSAENVFEAHKKGGFWHTKRGRQVAKTLKIDGLFLLPEPNGYDSIEEIKEKKFHVEIMDMPHGKFIHSRVDGNVIGNFSISEARELGSLLIEKANEWMNSELQRGGRR